LKDAQKNMFWLSTTLVIVNLLFLTLGALLYIYSNTNNLAIPASTDELFPRLALNEFGLVAGIFFLLGIIASSYASADSALAALTTSFCIDFLNFKNKNEKTKTTQKNLVHVGFSVLFIIIIVIFKEINQQSLILAVLTAASYTYGPLLGLFAFGIFTKLQVRDKLVPVVCVLSPLVSFWISSNSEQWFKFGPELLIVNGLLTFVGLFLISRKTDVSY
jgi:Na+/proline symporter